MIAVVIFFGNLDNDDIIDIGEIVGVISACHIFRQYMNFVHKNTRQLYKIIFKYLEANHYIIFYRFIDSPYQHIHDFLLDVFMKSEINGNITGD